MPKGFTIVLDEETGEISVDFDLPRGECEEHLKALQAAMQKEGISVDIKDMSVKGDANINKAKIRKTAKTGG